MREHPDMPLSEVWESSGFNNEKSISRSFKTHTGQTPSAWKTQK
jgi:AraC-like DNA-binding protein